MSSVSVVTYSPLPALEEHYNNLETCFCQWSFSLSGALPQTPLPRFGSAGSERAGRSGGSARVGRVGQGGAGRRSRVAARGSDLLLFALL